MRFGATVLIASEGGEGIDDRLRAILSTATGFEGAEDLLDEGGAGERRGGLGAGLLDKAQVLLHQLDHEAGGEVASHRAGTKVLDHPRTGGARAGSGSAKVASRGRIGYAGLMLTSLLYFAVSVSIVEW